jgi:arylsulfatase A-like enzyme
MGDDVGWFNIGAYHQGIMSGKTPSLDRLASQGLRFTDYYAEASCTAGRSNFITGELPIRTGLTTVGQAGADVGLPDEAATLATALKSVGYETGQFGKNHLDLNRYLPCVHGFDEFFGYLYHLDAMSDPYWFDFPPDWVETKGPRNLVHCWATDTDDSTVQPRWGATGKQKIEDEGPLAPFPNLAGRQNWQEGARPSTTWKPSTTCWSRRRVPRVSFPLGCGARPSRRAPLPLEGTARRSLGPRLRGGGVCYPLARHPLLL